MEDIILDSLDELPESLASLKGLAKPDGDKFRISFPKGENVEGLKSTLAKKDREAKRLSDELAAERARIAKLGDDVTDEDLEELVALRAKIKEQGGKEQVDKAQVQQMLKEEREKIAKKFADERKPIDEENTSLKSQLNKILIQDGIRQEASKEDLPFRFKVDADTLIDIAKSNDIFEIEDGRAVMRDGTLGSDGERAGVKDWLLKLAETRKALIEDSNGTGDAPRGTKRATPSAKPVSQMTPDEKGAFIEKYGYEAWTKKVNAERKLKAA